MSVPEFMILNVFMCSKRDHAYNDGWGDAVAKDSGQQDGEAVT